MRKSYKLLLKIIVILYACFLISKIPILAIDIEGISKVERETFITELFSDNNVKSLNVFINELLGRKKKIKYVENYKISFKTPLHIVINVKEKPNIGYIKKNTARAYFDSDGYICEITNKIYDGVPEVRGLSISLYGAGEKISIANNKLIKDIFGILELIYENKLPVLLFEYTKDDNINIFIDDITVEFGNTDNYKIKILRLKDIYPSIKGLKGTLDISKASENMVDEKYIFKKP